MNIAAGTMLLNCIGMTLCDLISVCSCHKHIQTLKIWNQTSKTQRCFHQYLMKIYKTISSRFKNTDNECFPKINILNVCQKLTSSINYYKLDRKTKLVCYSLFSLQSPKSHLSVYLSLMGIQEVGY